MKDKPYVNLENKPVFSKNIIILLLSIALLGAVGYIIFEKNSNKREIWLTRETIDELEQSRETLKQEFRLTRSEYDSAKNSILEKSEEMVEKDRLIFEKQKKIQDLLHTAKISRNDLDNAKDLIASLKNELIDYKRQIEILKHENRTLIAQNSDLETKNKLVNSEKNKIAENLSSEISQREKDKAAVNATLSVSNYNLQGVKVKSSGREVITERASRINKLKLSFDIDKNLSASKDSKEIYIAIFKPDGTLGKFEGANSGKLPLRLGSVIEYSDVVNVNYDPANGAKVAFDWKDYNFEKGTYTIDIYHNGFKIGQNKIQLK